MVDLPALAAEQTKTCTPSANVCDASTHVQPMPVDQLIVLSFCSDSPAFYKVADTRNLSSVLAVGDRSLSFDWNELVF